MMNSDLLENLRPPAADDQGVPSIFLFGLAKAGSTLLNRVLQPIAKNVGLTPYSLHQQLLRLGVAIEDCPPEFFKFYSASGYAYTGFRSYPHEFAIPEFASGRSVFLVRDPRDMIVSLYFSMAFSHRPPGSELSDDAARKFSDRRELARSREVNDYVLEESHKVTDQFEIMERKLDGISHAMFRYEDIIFDKRQWARSMVEYLKLDVPDPFVQRVVERTDVVPETEQAGQHIRKVTPGDHKDKLTPQTIATLNSRFENILLKYGYEV